MAPTPGRPASPPVTGSCRRPGEHLRETALGGAPKSGSRVSFGGVVAGLVIPQRKRARCLGAPSASGWPPRARQARAGRRLDRSAARLAARGSRCGASVEAVAAVPARLGARLAEVADERVHLAAVVRDELEDALDPRCLGPLAALEALEQALDAARRSTRAARGPCSAGATSAAFSSASPCCSR